MKVNKVVRKNHDAKTRYVFNEGGTRSGKTYGINQALYKLASENKYIISIVSETMPHLKKGAMRDFFSFLNTAKLYWPENHNKSEHTYKINDSMIEFFSADAVSKVHGPERDILFINEIQNIPYEIYFHLAQRTRIRIFADWNPTHRFYVHEMMEDPEYRTEITYTHSTIFDNKFVSDEIKKEVLRRADRDPNYKQVYLEGKIGIYEGLIFPTIQMVDEMPDGRSFYGMDFGYTQDPTTLIECKIIGDNLYLNELIYQTGLRNSDIINLMKQLDIRGVVYGDSAEPKTIDDLYFAGFNIHGAIKGPDSINFGLTIMKQFTIFVTKKSTNLVKEFRNYTYMKDKEGKMLNKPIDLWNHGIDATRYGVSMEQRKKLEYKEMNTIDNSRRL